VESAVKRSREEWIFTFHGIGPTIRTLDPGEDRIWIEADAFGGFLDILQSESRGRLTFDDGNASDHEIVLPALAKRKLQASFFVCAGLLGQPGYLRPEQVRELADSGMTIGCHGFDHRPWRGLTGEDLQLELCRATEQLEKIVGRTISEAACPRGAYDRRVLKNLKALGFTRVYTSDGGPADGAAWLTPRTTVRRHHTPESLVQLLHTRPSFAQRGARALRLAVKRWR